ncbi:MAG: hypothetical protein HC853_05920 [Anaerolineae bacterium]|nr:hypothetical protein [Anaerolineae bacterium]
MPQELQLDATQSLKDLLRFGISHGLDLIQKQGTIIPMVIALANGQHKITALSGPSKTPDQMAQAYLTSLPDAIEAYVVLLQGKVPLRDAMQDAIIMLSGESVRAFGHRLAQPYRRNMLRRVTRLVIRFTAGARSSSFAAANYCWRSSTSMLQNSAPCSMASSSAVWV